MEVGVHGVKPSPAQSLVVVALKIGAVHALIRLRPMAEMIAQGNLTCRHHAMKIPVQVFYSRLSHFSVLYHILDNALHKPLQ